MLKSFPSATSNAEEIVPTINLSTKSIPTDTATFTRASNDKPKKQLEHDLNPVMGASSILLSSRRFPLKCEEKNFQDEVLQYTPLSSSEDYCVPTNLSYKIEPYVRSKLSFEDPEIERNRHGVTPRMLEVYDYLTLKLDAIYNGRPSFEHFTQFFQRAVPRLCSKEWNVHYSRICPDDRRRDDNDNDDSDDRRSRKRVQRFDKPEKQKKMKFSRDRD
uniref:Uncharacterized protein n=1 Tax=Syphacia muris TaxID=451379 RepID=A0A0N5AMQ0_9BILA